MSIDLPKDVRTAAIESMQRYFAEHFEEPLGNLQAAALLDYFVQEIGPTLYNQAIADAQSALQRRVMELDIECHEDEFAYWQQQKRKR